MTKTGNGKRYGLGFTMREVPAISDSWITFLRSNGGDLGDLKTHEILVSKPPAVEALRYCSHILNKYHVVPPDAVTWSGMRSSPTGGTIATA